MSANTEKRLDEHIEELLAIRARFKNNPLVFTEGFNDYGIVMIGGVQEIRVRKTRYDHDGEIVRTWEEDVSGVSGELAVYINRAFCASKGALPALLSEANSHKLTTPEPGALEDDGIYTYFVGHDGVRRKVAKSFQVSDPGPANILWTFMARNSGQKIWRNVGFFDSEKDAIREREKFTSWGEDLSPLYTIPRPW